MEGMTEFCPLSEVLGGKFAGRFGRFTLVDIGCSGGIGRNWLVFGKRLRAVGFDPSVAEIERLQKENQDADIRYVSGFATIPEEHPFIVEKGHSRIQNNPWSRLACQASMEIQKELRTEMSDRDKMIRNAWKETRLSDEHIIVPEWLQNNGYNNVDFLKLDVDGPDYDILRSFDGFWDKFGILAVGAEVNYIGSENDSDHTFHNTDRYMRSQGFSLFGLTVRHYASSALPSRYLAGTPAQSVIGRPLQGDALYMRDLCAPKITIPAMLLSPEKLINAALIASIFRLPDVAAGILLKFKDTLEPVIEFEDALDALAIQMQYHQDGRNNKSMSYKEYMEKFNNDDPYFYT